MEHTGMARMFQTLVDTWIEGFLASSGSVYEAVVVEFFTNTRVIVGTIGVTSFLDVPKETVMEMRNRFSGSDVPFRALSRKREMKMEFRLLHDIVAKALCAKAGSLDMVLVNMVNNSKGQSQRFAVQVSVLLEKLMKADLGESVKLHPQKVLTNKSVQTYIKKNLDVKPAGESSKQTKDTASGTEAGQSNMTKHVEMQTDTQPSVEAGGQVALTEYKSGTSSDEDSCTLAGLKERHAKHKQVFESPDSEATVSIAMVKITKKHRTKRTMRPNPKPRNRRPSSPLNPPPPPPPRAAAAAAHLRRKIVSSQFDEENPFVLISSVLLVQADEGVSFLVMDRIGDFFRNLPRRADVIVTTIGARHKCQQGSGFKPPIGACEATADQEVQTVGTDSNAEGHEERMEYETQTYQGAQDENVFTIAQDEQEKSTGGCPEGTTYVIEAGLKRHHWKPALCVNFPSISISLPMILILLNDSWQNWLITLRRLVMQKRGKEDKAMGLKEDKDRVDNGKVQAVLRGKEQIIKWVKEAASIRGEDGFDQGRT
ncbi:hypothetical protein F511_01149 [Dorcoceras hygrometricum]|nr:hypothetical protein F511_01149 [Dorcoceras hygrometricum]